MIDSILEDCIRTRETEREAPHRPAFFIILQIVNLVFLANVAISTGREGSSHVSSFAAAVFGCTVSFLSLLVQVCCDPCAAKHGDDLNACCACSSFLCNAAAVCAAIGLYTTGHCSPLLYVFILTIMPFIDLLWCVLRGISRAYVKNSDNTLLNNSNTDNPDASVRVNLDPYLGDSLLSERVQDPRPTTYRDNETASPILV